MGRAMPPLAVATGIAHRSSFRSGCRPELLKTPAILCGAAIVAVAVAGLVLVHLQKIAGAAKMFVLSSAGFSLLVGGTLLAALEECKVSAPHGSRDRGQRSHTVYRW